MFSVEEVKNCRMCGSENLQLVLDLGNQYVVDFVKVAGETSRGKAPLQLVYCDVCKLVQLKHTVNADSLFQKFYYRSSINEQMRAALKDIVRMAELTACVREEDHVLDIGANDGALLDCYSGVMRVGVDPCAEVLEDAVAHGRMDKALTGYFSEALVRDYAPFKVITAIAMFYDVPDPVGFLKQCRAVLDKDGVLIIQMNYLVEMMKNCAVDNICHEHLTYFSLTTLKAAVDRAGLEVAGVELNQVNGGSLRAYITHKSGGMFGAYLTRKQLDLAGKVTELLREEKQLGLGKKEVYSLFKSDVEDTVTCVHDYLVEQKKRGKRIYAYGASTRGTVLLQLLNLPDAVISGAAERDPAKIGLHMVGTDWLKIYDEEFCRTTGDIMLVLPWHFLESISKREANFIAKGGKLLFPLPTPRVVTKYGTEKLYKMATA